MTAGLVSRCGTSAPPRTRTGNLLIKRTLLSHAWKRKYAHIKDIGKPVLPANATEYPHSAAPRHDIRHDTFLPLPGGHARRAACFVEARP